MCPMRQSFFSLQLDIPKLQTHWCHLEGKSWDSQETVICKNLSFTMQSIYYFTVSHTFYSLYNLTVLLFTNVYYYFLTLLLEKNRFTWCKRNKISECWRTYHQMEWPRHYVYRPTPPLSQLPRDWLKHTPKPSDHFNNLHNIYLGLYTSKNKINNIQ